MTTPNPERDLSIKSFGALDVKDADKGEVEAIIATINVVDRDREVILPGAVASGAKAKISLYGHSAMFGEMPVGKGQIFVRDDKLVFKGRYFISTGRGADAFATLKELGEDQEWSFGFKVLDAENAPEDWAKRGAYRMLKKLEPVEVSPVMVGAGIGTQTVSTKQGDGAPPERSPEELAADEAARAVAEQAAAEAKAAADTAAEEEEARVAREEEARVTERAALKQAAADEFDRFQRNLRRFRA